MSSTIDQLTPLSLPILGSDVVELQRPSLGAAGSGKSTVDNLMDAAPVQSVFGRAGAIVAASNDYTWAQIDKTVSALTDIATRPFSALQSIPTTLVGYGITDAQPLDADLTALAALVSAADKLPYATGAGTWSLADFSAFGRSLVDDANAAAARATLGLVIGTDVQTQDLELSALAALVSAADKLPYFTGVGAAALADFTAAGRALVDDADASAQRTTLGLGALAVLATVGTSQIDNDAVTYAKIQNISLTQRLLGRNTAGAGDTEEVTASQSLDWIGSTRGALLYRGLSGWAALAPGTSGDVLTSNGAGADPTYQAAAGGGTPGGSDTQLQRNNAGAFGGISGAISDGTSVTLLSPTIDGGVNAKILSSTGYSLTGADATNGIDIAGTWNTTGNPTGFKFNITNTASGATSLLADLQIGGSSRLSVGKLGETIINLGTSGDRHLVLSVSGTTSKGTIGNYVVAASRQLYYFGSNYFVGIGAAESRFDTGIVGTGFLIDNGVTSDTSEVTLRHITAAGALTAPLAMRGGTGLGTGLALVTGGIFGWTSQASNVAGSALDTGIGRNAAAIAEFNNGTPGQWGSLKLGVRDAGLNTAPVGLTIAHQTTGTKSSITAGMGSSLLFNSDNTVAADENAAQISAILTTPTQASLVSDLVFYARTGGAALAEVGRLTGAGSFLLGAGYAELNEMTAPANAAANKCRLFAEDNGAGKTRLVVIFPSGAAQVIATEP